MTKRLSSRVTLLVFLVLVVGGGISIGIFTAPGAWYAGLTKPFFNPPNWIFGPVWTILYIFIAIAGERTWRVRNESRAFQLWATGLALNFMWSPIFFAAERPGWALIVILLLLLMVLALIKCTWSRDRWAATLFIPYAAWVAFASLLNGAIFVLN
jgi:tryptophan-rich sensory protein